MGHRPVQRTHRILAVSIILACGATLANGCRSRTFGDAPRANGSGGRVASAAAEPATFPPWSCGVPTESQFAARPDSDPAKAVLAREAASPRWAFLGTAPWDLPEGARARWLERAAVPLMMGCRSFEEKGALRYGEAALVDFLAILARVLDGSFAKETLAEAKRPFLSFDPFLPAKDHLDVAMLRAVNALLHPEGKGRLRGPGEARIHGEALDEAQRARVEALAKEGVVSLFVEKEPFPNAKGEMVSGAFIRYPEGETVEGHMREWERRASSLSASAGTSPVEVAGKVAALTLRCTLVHPFGDANGRTCTLWGAWKLAALGLPHAVVWSGSDAFLTTAEWSALGAQGVDAHATLLQSLRTGEGNP